MVVVLLLRCWLHTGVTVALVQSGGLLIFTGFKRLAMCNFEISEVLSRCMNVHTGIWRFNEVEKLVKIG